MRKIWTKDSCGLYTLEMLPLLVEYCLIVSGTPIEIIYWFKKNK